MIFVEKKPLVAQLRNNKATTRFPKKDAAEDCDGSNNFENTKPNMCGSGTHDHHGTIHP